MRLYMEIDYDEDPGEDMGAVVEAFADIVHEQDGVAFVRVHGPDATLIPSPSRPCIERGH